jgi:glycosyltransferase involved in cell wall biosynthesis
VATVEYAIVAFFLHHIIEMSRFYNITVLTNTKNPANLKESLGGIKVVHIPFERKVSIKKDLIALWMLIRHFHQNKYDAIHSLTPKGGLLAMVAGFFCNVPIRIHTFTGQVWATKNGIKRWFLLTMDKVVAVFATAIMADSYSQKEFIVRKRVVSNSKASVLAHGSICGVDTKRFMPNAASRSSLRMNYSINENDIVILYLGRMNRDKGLLDLAQAFGTLCKEFNCIHLMLVGPDEQNIATEIYHLCRDFIDKVHLVGYTHEPEKYMNGADIFCLPSYREGFGNAIVEAAAIGIPSVASRIYGITDAVEDRITGLLHDARNIQDLEEKIRFLINNNGARIAMGMAARERVVKYFAKEVVTQEMINYYYVLFSQTRPSG